MTELTCKDFEEAMGTPAPNGFGMAGRNMSLLRQRAKDSLPLEALLWAWTNAAGRLPDSNTMTADEIDAYWNDYRSILQRAITQLGGVEPA